MLRCRIGKASARMALGVAVVLCALAPGLLRAADKPVTDQDKRAAATLYSAYAHKELKWEAMSAKDLDGLTQWLPDPATKKARYALAIGGGGGTTGLPDTRGYLRIYVNEAPVDPKKDNWQIMPVDKVTGADGFYKETRSSTAGVYHEVGVRRQFGNIILSVAQRQPASQKSQAEAIQMVVERYAELAAYAKKNQLMGGKVVLTLLSRGDEPKMESEMIPVALGDQEETRCRIRVELRDADDKPMANIKHYSFRLAGPLAASAVLVIDGEKVDALSKKYIKEDPPQIMDVVLILPKRSTTVDQKLYELASPAPAGSPVPDPGVHIEVGAKLK